MSAPLRERGEGAPEALAWGWVDSRPGSLDEDRTMLWFAPRKPGQRLVAAGQAVVDAAKASGRWELLDDVEDGLVPDDLDAALEWIVQAKRPETRAKRIAETADRAARGGRANQWTRR